MKVTLDTPTIQRMNLFSSLTKCSVIDCIDDGGDLYFVVSEGQYGLAVGKGGAKVRRAEKIFKKSIKVFEYSRSLERFVRNVVPELQSIEINGTDVTVKIRHADRPQVIGKSGKNVKIIKTFLQRLFDIESFKVK